MAKKELYYQEGINKDRFTPLGLDISGEIAGALRPILERHARRGASIRELGYIAHAEVEMVVCEYIISPDWNKGWSEDEGPEANDT